MNNFILIYYFLFYLIILYKLTLIINDKKIQKHALKQYFKKSKNKIIRGNIYDKNKLLINYTKKKYIIHNNKKYIIEKREYFFPSCISITGIVNNELNGLSGLELFYNNYLNIKKKIQYFPRFSTKEKFKEIYKKNKKNHLFTTIDAILSEKIYKILEKNVLQFQSQYGFCIIMDGNTGEIEAITQYPQYSELNKNNIDIKFLYPIGITQSYEVGSIIKVFLMLSALNEKIVNLDTPINCYGVKEKIIQGKILTTWKAHNTITFKQVIKESNNFGVAQIGLLLNDKLFHYYSLFGFGEKTKIPIHGEHSGILNSINKWSKRTPISLSFGYEMSCTLLQLVSAWSIFTNEGKRVLPKILINEETKYSKKICSDEAILNSLEILYFNQNDLKKYGLKNIIDANLFGKTGTANTLINNQYNKDLNIYTFVGHIEKNNKKKIIGISIYGSNNPKLLSSQIALPIFLEIANIIEKKIKQ